MSVASDSRAVCLEVVRLLHAERERQKLSKYALSAKCGISQQAIGYIERGTSQPAFETVVQIARGLDVDLPTLIRAAEAAVQRATDS